MYSYKIEDLGSKKEVKDYLEIMRNEFRKEYMEGIYGTEKANRILNELEYGLKVHPMEMDENYTGQLGEEGGEGSSSRVMPRMGYAAGAYDDGEEEEEEGPAVPVVNPYTNKNTESVNEEVAKETSPENTVGNDENATAGDKNKSLLEGKTMTRGLRHHLRMTILATMTKTTTRGSRRIR